MSHRLNNCRYLYVTMSIAAVSASAVAGNDPVRIDFLGTLGSGHSSYALGINNSGQVVGGSGSSSSNAFRYTDGIGMIDLGAVAPQFRAEAQDISDSGETVGFSFGSGHDVGFRHRDGVGMTQVGPGQSVGASRVFGINVGGTATGYSYALGIGTRAFVQNSGGAIQSFGDTSTTPQAINDNGVVAGYTSVSSLQTAFVRSSTGTMTYLTPPFGSNRSAANDINNAGKWVGETWNNSLASTGAFSYSQSEGFVRLPTLTNASRTTALGVNEAGWIVGWSEG